MPNIAGKVYGGALISRLTEKSEREATGRARRI